MHALKGLLFLLALAWALPLPAASIPAAPDDSTRLMYLAILSPEGPKRLRNMDYLRLGQRLSYRVDGDSSVHQGRLVRLSPQSAWILGGPQDTVQVPLADITQLARRSPAVVPVLGILASGPLIWVSVPLLRSFQNLRDNPFGYLVFVLIILPLALLILALAGQLLIGGVLALVNQRKRHRLITAGDTRRGWQVQAFSRTGWQAYRRRKS